MIMNQIEVVVTLLEVQSSLLRLTPLSLWNNSHELDDTLLSHI